MRRLYTRRLLRTDACIRTPLHTNTFYILLYTQTLSHTNAFTRKCFYTHGRSYTQTPLHAQRLWHTHTDTLTHRRFSTHTLSYTNRRFYTHSLLHTDAFAHTKCFYTQTPLHGDALTTLLHKKAWQSTSQYYFVLQSLRRVREGGREKGAIGRGERKGR